MARIDIQFSVEALEVHLIEVKEQAKVWQAITKRRTPRKLRLRGSGADRIEISGRILATWGAGRQEMT